MAYFWLKKVMTDLNFERLKFVSLNAREAASENKESITSCFYSHYYLAHMLMRILLSLKKNCDTDRNLEKTQRGHCSVFERGTNHSAGVTIFLNKFNGDTPETTEDGLWLWVKRNKAEFIFRSQSQHPFVLLGFLLGFFWHI